MPAIYEHARVVQPAEIDRLGHVNNLVYLRWMLDAAVAHSAVQGWTAERYEQLGGGWVVRSHEIKYVEPAYDGQKVVVHTWVADMTKVSSTRRYRIVRADDERVLAKAATRWAFVDFASGTLRRIPDEVVESFELVAP
ncbi:MAG: acyl-CoA thioesterase [Planctomycetota bacterium]|nr:MAG: acyl-CoA thioesterase [Planctomycetota bacterium]